MSLNKIIFNCLLALKDKERFVVHIPTTSMWPLIGINDQVVVEKVKIEEVSKYDVIIFYSYKLKKIVIHRVIKSYKFNNKIVFSTKGDNNPKNDEDFVTEKNFLAKAILIKNKKIDLGKNNYFWLSIHFNSQPFANIKQRLFYFFYNS